jgi:hypothetical protein
MRLERVAGGIEERQTRGYIRDLSARLIRNPLQHRGFRASRSHVIRCSARLLEESSTVRFVRRSLRGRALVVVARVVGVMIAGRADRRPRRRPRRNGRPYAPVKCRVCGELFAPLRPEWSEVPAV